MKNIFWGRALTLVILFCTFFSNRGIACTAFLLKRSNGEFVVGKSYDWFRGYGHGAMFTNARNLKKTALNITNKEKPAQWVSKYGSITFTQFGRELPISGINEKGLVVEMLQLKHSQYNSDEISKPFVNESQFTAYILDNYPSLKKMMTDLPNIRVEKAFTGIHYFVCDAQAECAVLEFIDGKLHVYSTDKLPVPALTNHPYEYLLKDYKKTKNQDSHGQMGVRSSLYRFWKAAKMISQAQDQNDLEPYAFKILDAVKFDGPTLERVIKSTQWQVVYNPVKKSVSFQTRDSMNIKTVNVRDFNFSCKAKGRMLDMNLDFSGPVGDHLIDFNLDTNNQLIDKNHRLVPSSTLEKAKTIAALSECLD